MNLFVAISIISTLSADLLQPQPKINGSCSSESQPERITLRHIESSGVGYTTGYTTLEGFFTIPQEFNSDYLPFLDIRGHIFNNGKFAANAGLGLRYLTSRIYGGNIYYDYRKGKKSHYNQVSAGLESLGTRWDFRVNGYFPVGSSASPYYNPQFAYFQTHNIYLSLKQQFAMTGCNGEVGYHLNKMKHFEGYAAVGPYYFEGKGNHAIGGEARFLAKFFDFLGMQLSVSYDSVFKTNVQGELSLSLALGPKQKTIPKNNRSCSASAILRHRALQKIDRNEIIVLDTERNSRIAINPSTGNPYFVWFVNNTSNSLGTFESPFPTLLQAENASSPFDIIYVFEGDGTSTGMNAGITLKNNQMILGSGTIQTIPTTVGDITIPSFTSGMPLVTHPGAIGITLANNNIVSGIHIDDALFGISGTNIENATIQNNVLSASSLQTSIDLTEAIGNIYITNNSISTTINNPASVGISIGNNGSSSTIYIAGNHLTGHAGSGISIQGTGAASQEIWILNNSIVANFIDPNAAGINIGEQNTSTASVYIANNAISLQDMFGIVLSSQNEAYIHSSILNNTVVPGLLSTSLNVGIIMQMIDNSVQNAIVVSNSVSATKNFGIGLVNQGAGNGTIQLFKNMISDGGQDPSAFFFGGGIAIAPQGEGNIQADIEGNRLIHNLGEGGLVIVALNIGMSPTPGSTCLRLLYNESDTGYLLYNPDLGVGGFPLINLENGYQTNVGLINGVPSNSPYIPPAPDPVGFGPGGPITIVPAGTCL